MPTFKPPYGTADQHVISTAQHFGYHYLVAVLVDGGRQAEYIRGACVAAYEARAPRDVVSLVREESGGWRRRAGITNLIHGRRLDTYAAALTKYEQELKAERQRGGS